MEAVVTTGLLELQVVQSSSQIITTNKPTSSFFTGRMPFVSPNQQCQSTERKKYHIPWPCSQQAHLGSSNFVSDHSLEGGLPCLSSALWCQHPNLSVCQQYDSKSRQILMKFFGGLWCSTSKNWLDSVDELHHVMLWLGLQLPWDRFAFSERSCYQKEY